jgi:hypothetical protein
MEIAGNEDTGVCQPTSMLYYQALFKMFQEEKTGWEVRQMGWERFDADITELKNEAGDVRLIFARWISRYDCVERW